MNFTLRLFLACLALSYLPGCGKSDHGHTAAGGGHAHTAPHGGVLVELGDHAANLEVLRNAATGKLTVWVLDGHAENFLRLKATSLALVATIGAEKRPLTLQAVANSATGETVGDTSQFETQADWLKGTAPIEFAVPALEIRGAKFAPTTFRLPPATK
ncbi:MAG: hypothetical protein FJ399_23365 [Verrucomicrobia bacterium]|nr:hypothetical protein [Verrucomicrobiota bacterium]